MLCTTLHAQTIVKETTYVPEGKASAANLKSLEINKDKNEISLFHLTKNNAKKSSAEIIYFDLDLKYLRTENLEEDIEKINSRIQETTDTRHTPKFTSEHFPIISVESNITTEQPSFSKGYIVTEFNYTTGMVGDKFSIEEKIKPNKGEEDRIKYVTHWSNNDVLNYRRRVSHYASSDKFSTTYVSYNESKATQMIRGDKGDLILFGLITTNMVNLSKDPESEKKYATQTYGVKSLSKVKEVPLNFDVAAAAIYSQILYNGNIALIFQRLDQKIEFVELDYEGNTVRRFIKDSPTDGVWCVNNLKELENGDIVVSGIVSKSTFNKEGLGLIDASHLIDVRLKEHSVKSIGYQIMKINSKEINLITYNSIEDFASTFIQIDGEKKGKPYIGGYTGINGITLTKSGDFIVNGQIKNLYDEMQDMFIFYFDKNGKLISNFACPIREKTIIPAEQQLIASNHSDDYYWVINEATGQEVYGDHAQILKITKIASGGKKINPFISPGNNESFLDENYSISQLGNDTFLFFGWDRKGKEMTLSKVVID